MNPDRTVLVKNCFQNSYKILRWIVSWWSKVILFFWTYLLNSSALTVENEGGIPDRKITLLQCWKWNISILIRVLSWFQSDFSSKIIIVLRFNVLNFLWSYNPGYGLLQYLTLFERLHFDTYTHLTALISYIEVTWLSRHLSVT